eukprot:COSAG02_NODE_11140_length_1784_cov_3.138279_1_plen_267_part_00
MCENVPPEHSGISLLVAMADVDMLQDYITRTEACLKEELKKRRQLVTSDDKPPTGMSGWAPYEASSVLIRKFRRHLEIYKRAMQKKLADEYRAKLKASFSAIFTEHANDTREMFYEAIQHQVATLVMSEQKQKEASAAAKPRVKDLADLVAAVEGLDELDDLRTLDAEELSQLFDELGDLLLPATTTLGKVQRRKLLKEHRELVAEEEHERLAAEYERLATQEAERKRLAAAVRTTPMCSDDEEHFRRGAVSTNAKKQKLGNQGCS